ncbi:hypothetical protein D3C85_1171550 [compost metagenome]
MVGRLHGNADVRLSGQKVRRQLIERHAAVVHPRVGMAGAKTLQRHRNQALAEAGAGHDLQHPRARLPQAGGQVVDPLDAAIHLLDLSVQAPRFGRGRQPALDPFEQPIAQPAFRQRQHPAHRRLRHMQHAPRAADRTGHHDGAEHLDLAQVQGPSAGGSGLVGIYIRIHFLPLDR